MGENVTPTVKHIGLVDLAKAFKISAKQLERELALFAWGTLMNEAERLRFGEHFDAPGKDQNKKTTLEELSSDTDRPVHWRHLVAATKNLLPHITDLPPEKVPELSEHLEGYLYVLYDGVSKLSKIGCTRNNGRRQRAIMGAHGSVLANILNAKVADCRAAEAQCHKHFQEFRRNGEWFNVDLKTITEYVGQEIEWAEIDMEHVGRLAQYIAACELGDMKAAKHALCGPNFPQI